MERCVLEFYKKMRDQIEHDYGRETFATLFSEEQYHIVILRQLLKSQSGEAYASYFGREQYKPQNGLVAYAMRVFSKAEELTRANNAREALTIGMEMEIESTFYFARLRGMFRGDEQDLIARILNGDNAHLLRLIAMLKKTES
jgi:rubrerythrin